MDEKEGLVLHTFLETLRLEQLRAEEAVRQQKLMRREMKRHRKELARQEYDAERSRWIEKLRFVSLHAFLRKKYAYKGTIADIENLSREELGEIRRDARKRSYKITFLSGAVTILLSGFATASAFLVSPSDLVLNLLSFPSAFYFIKHLSFIRNGYYKTSFCRMCAYEKQTSECCCPTTDV